MENTLLNMIPSSYIPEVHLSQYDIGRNIQFKLMDGNSEYTVPSGANIKILATKPSGLGFEVACTFSGNIVTLVNTETMSNEAGRFRAELRITSGNVILGTSNFIMNVERSPHPEGTIDGDAETLLPELTLLVERIEAAASSVLDMQVVADTLPPGSQATYSYDESLNKATFGIPQGEPGAGTIGTVASAYDASKTYAVGDYAIHDNNLYRCITAITTAEAFTASHWTKVVLTDDVTDLKSDLNGIRTENLFKVENANIGKYLNATGQEVSNVGSAYTDYIKVEEGESLVLGWYQNTITYGWNLRIHGYANDKTWVSQLFVKEEPEPAGTYSEPFIIPSNISYIRVSLFPYSSLANIWVYDNPYNVGITAVDKTSRKEISTLNDVKNNFYKTLYKELEITGIATSGYDGGIRTTGECYYNWETKLIRRCTQHEEGGTNSFETIPFDLDMVLVDKPNGNKYIRHDGMDNGLLLYSVAPKYPISREIEILKLKDNSEVLVFTGIGETGLGSGVTKKGDVFYNTNSNKFRRCVVYDRMDGDTYEDVEPHKYYYNRDDGKFYVINNGTLAESSDIPQSIWYTDAECKARFYEEMRKKASIIGLTNFVFEEPAGNLTINRMTAYDIMRLACYLAGIRQMNDVWQRKSATVNVYGENARTLNITTTVTNASLEEDYTILGGKTGSIPDTTQSLAVVVRSKRTGKIYCCSDINTSLTVGVKFTHIKQTLDYIEGAGNDPAFTQGGVCVIELPQYQTALFNRFNFDLAYSYNVDTAFIPASTTKMMTAIVMLDNINDLNENVIIKSSDIQPPTGSTFYAGDIVKVSDLLICLMLESSNTSAHALARIVGMKLLEQDANNI